MKNRLCFFKLFISSFSLSATQFWRSKVLDVARDFPEYTFAIADEEDYAEELKSLGLSESGEEVNVGILADGGKKFAMEPEEFDSEVLREFVVAFKKGGSLFHVASLLREVFFVVLFCKLAKFFSMF